MREVERDSPFTFTRDLVRIASLVFANVNITHIPTQKLRDSRNPPLRTILGCFPTVTHRLISTDAFLATHVNARKF